MKPIWASLLLMAAPISGWPWGPSLCQAGSIEYQTTNFGPLFCRSKAASTPESIPSTISDIEPTPSSFHPPLSTLYTTTAIFGTQRSVYSSTVMNNDQTPASNTLSIVFETTIHATGFNFNSTSSTMIPPFFASGPGGPGIPLFTGTLDVTSGFGTPTEIQSLPGPPESSAPSPSDPDITQWPLFTPITSTGEDSSTGTTDSFSVSGTQSLTAAPVQSSKISLTTDVTQPGPTALSTTGPLVPEYRTTATSMSLAMSTLFQPTPVSFASSVIVLPAVPNTTTAPPRLTSTSSVASRSPVPAPSSVTPTPVTSEHMSSAAASDTASAPPASSLGGLPSVTTVAVSTQNATLPISIAELTRTSPTPVTPTIEPSSTMLPTSAPTPSPSPAHAADSSSHNRTTVAVAILLPLLVLVITILLLAYWRRKHSTELCRTNDLEQIAVWVRPQSADRSGSGMSRINEQVEKVEMRTQEARERRIFSGRYVKKGLAEPDWNEARSVRASRIGLAFGEAEDWDDGLGKGAGKMPELRDVGGLLGGTSQGVQENMRSNTNVEKSANTKAEEGSSVGSPNKGSEQENKQYVMVGDRKMEVPSETSDVLANRLARWINARKGMEPLVRD